MRGLTSQSLTTLKGDSRLTKGTSKNTMKQTILANPALVILLCSLLSVVACGRKDPAWPGDASSVEGIAMWPVLFGAQFATDSDNRHSALAFSPDGSEVFYSVYVSGRHPQKIFVAKRSNGVWGEPSVASFSGTYKDGGPLFSRDGERIYFYSKRPIAPSTVANDDYDIWFVQRTGDGWSRPIHVEGDVNTDHDESTYTITGNGDLYFSRRTADSKDFLYKTSRAGDLLETPEIIKELSDQQSSREPVSIEGEDFFIFTNNVQKGRFYYTSLHVSFKSTDGSWTRPKDMGDMINSGEGRFPSLSPDGREFYFLSYRSGISQFYRVEATIIDYLRTHDLDLVEQLKTIMQESGIKAMTSALDAFSHDHATYYRFDSRLLNDVAGELVAENAITEAVQVYELNFERYPQQQLFPQRLTVALLNGSEDGFDRISVLIEKEPAESRRDLLDEINRTGEVFLQEGRTNDAIRIFELNASINPESTWPPYKLGKAYIQLEDKEAARTSFRAALQLDADNRYAKEYLEEIGFPQLSGPYLGQEPPGMTPEPFAPGVLVARDGDAINSVFSPDGNEFYYVILEDQSPRYNLWFTQRVNGVWATPRELRLAGEYEVADIAISPDGERLYFCSDRPTYWDDAEGFDIWYVEREEDGWSEPINAGRTINTPGGETQPSFTTDGAMYFPSWNNNRAEGDVDLFYAGYMNGEFYDSEALDGDVNSIHNEGNSFVSPDGSYILFARWGMPKHIDGGKGLYISFRNPDGSWGEAVNTKPVLKHRGSLAALTHDGKYLLWSTPKGFYWVDVRALEALRMGTTYRIGEL